MQKYFLILCCLSGITLSLRAQIPGRAEMTYNFPAGGAGRQTSPVLDIPLKETGPFVTLTLRCSGTNLKGGFEIRTTAGIRDWGPWQPMHDDPHIENPAGRRQFEMIFFPSGTRFFQLRRSEASEPLAAELIYYMPLEAPLKDPVPEAPAQDRGACPCPQPAFVTRTGWGGPPNQQPGCTPAYTNVTHLVVHHQAGAANPPYAATVMAIWQLHVNTNGWCDIGYNWLIAPDGTVFEGRAGGNNVIGAHFSGNNSNTMGVCFLGNFQNDQPTAAALESLEQLLAWKACDSNIDPAGTALHAASGLTLHRICGHRDGGATLCPGENLYAKLPSIRLETDSLYRDPSGCDGVWPPANDACAAATMLVSAETCQPVTATTDGATGSGVSIPACNDFTSDSALDVWFRFTATEAKHRVTVTPLGQAPNALDPVVALYDGNCNTPQLIDCIDAPGGSGGVTALTAGNLTPGQEYRVRVFDFGAAQAAEGRFDICVTHGASVGTFDTGLATQWRIFPNPASAWLTVQLPEIFPAQSAFRLLNIGGISVRQQPLSARQTRIDLAGLPAGIYLAEWRTDAGVEMKRVLVQGK